MIDGGGRVVEDMAEGRFLDGRGGSVEMDIKEGLKVMRFEWLMGLRLRVVWRIIFGVFQVFGWGDDKK
ncbi:hypothetical protein [Bacillus sp. WP8]|uniref:hypothetical protein n=1 Tax=Bacillus sp. WP8 TaxID=756828 RepID=UPI00119FC041|nr:hypothetical protein [Bacillus sp. WP8]